MQVYIVFNATRGDRGKPVYVFSSQIAAKDHCTRLNSIHGDLENEPFIEPFEFIELTLDRI